MDDGPGGHLVTTFRELPIGATFHGDRAYETMDPCHAGTPGRKVYRKLDRHTYVEIGTGAPHITTALRRHVWAAS